MSLEPGARLGPYEILAQIGEGGMGAVYKARDTRLDRMVAIKVSQRQFNDRFEREARAIAALNHPNICTLFDVGPDYLVMELVEGPTLAERIAKGRLPTAEALPIAKQIAEALEAAHEKNIIHRDLKPANVKLTTDGLVKVLDFGLAKAARESVPSDEEETETVSATKAGSVIGTAAYMPPEQARGETVDKRADIWSFGVVLYEMTTGKRPFKGKTTADLLVAVLSQTPDWDAVPLKVRRLVERCLEKDPKQRIRDAGDVRLALKEEPLIHRSPTRILPWALSAALALLAAYHWWPAHPASRPLVRLDVDLGPDAISNVTQGPTAILSPDGTRLVYVARGPSGKQQLFTRKLDQEQASPLPGTEDAIGPFFSPDGQSVGFFTDNKLKTISLAGGSPVALCDVRGERGGSWAEDGNIYAVLDFNNPVSRIPSTGGEARPVTELNKAKHEITHRWPQVLPGAQTMLFTAHTSVGNFDEATVEMQSLRTGQRKTLVNGGHFGRYSATGHLLYVLKGMLYAAPLDAARMELTGPAVAVLDRVWRRLPSGGASFDLARSGALLYVKDKPVEQTLDWLDSTGRTQPLRAAASPYNFTIRLSPDGKRLAVASAESGNLDIWVYEWERDTMTRLTFNPSTDTWPVWAPDGKHIAFVLNTGGMTNIHWMRADGTGTAIRLTEGQNLQTSFSMSPDGRRLAFTETSLKTGRDLWTLPLEDPTSDHPKPGKPEPFLQTPFNESTPMISPDGRWLAYGSDESGTNEIYVRGFPASGGKWQISTGGGDWPVWSKKTQELFYRNRDGMMVASYTASGGQFQSAKPRLWVEKKDLSQWFDLAPDGKRFAIVQDAAAQQRSSTQVTFLLNFFDEINRRVPPAGTSARPTQ